MSKSNHRDRQFFLARGMFSLAAAILIGLVVWIGVRAGGPASAGDDALMVQPATDLRAAESTTTPLEAESPSESATSSPSASVSASPSASASSSATPSASATSSATPKPSKTSASPKPTATKTTTTPPASNDLSVTCGFSSRWDDNFIASVTVTNNGTKAHNWKATVTYKPSSYSVTGGPWNAKPAAFNGNQIELVGTSSLSGKSSITAGFAGRKGAKGSAQPTGCSVVATAG